MNLIVGLGNIGNEYDKTRHNIGFEVIDKITSNLNQSLLSNINNPNFKAKILKHKQTLYIKPTTYMNLSGESIVAIKNYYKIENSEIIIIHDDLDLPFGTVKFKIGGGHGGHNGLRSLDANIDKDYTRVRVGIGKPQDKSQIANYVLKSFSKDELKILDEIIIPHIIKAIDELQKNIPIDKKSINQISSDFTFKLTTLI
jgi:PTH1 family peptidyl-tRNA hydrolase